MDTSNTKRIASDMVQELVKLGVSEGDSRDIVHKMTDTEILLLDEIYDGDIEDLALDIMTADRVILDDSGHVQVVVLRDLRDTVMNSMDRLLGLTAVLLPIPEKKNGMTRGSISISTKTSRRQTCTTQYIRSTSEVQYDSIYWISL